MKGMKKKRPTKEEVKAAADRAEARSRGEDFETESQGPLDPPESRGRGRPTKYKPEYAEQARKLCSLGATDADLAKFFQVDTTTIWRWQTSHPDFCNSLVVGKGFPDDRVERSLYQRAVGYSYDAVKIMKHGGEIVHERYTEHVPPDPGAAMMWLKNRRSDSWRDLKQHEVGTPGEFAAMTDDELRAEHERLSKDVAAVLHDGTDTVN